MRVLGIESSCDDLSVAVYDSEAGLLAHEIHSQTALHVPYGGVVPELASRDHIRAVVPLVKRTLREGNIDLTSIEGVAFTRGPGLAGALLVGACFGRTLAFALGVPALGVHHLEAHLLAVMLEEKHPDFPFLALLVSGGHTQLIDVQGLGAYRVLGETLDDAVGEAFDKIGKLMGFPYPGGPKIAAIASEGDPKRFAFTRPLCDRPGLDFSFSGLKTQVTQAWHKLPAPVGQDRADIAASFQAAVVDTLLIKTKRALEETRHTRVVIAGGVGANLALREGMTSMLEARDGQAYYPRAQFCTDNGAMVAYLGCQRLMRGESDDLTMDIRARWELPES